jgi:hypothetical protein
VPESSSWGQALKGRDNNGGQARTAVVEDGEFITPSQGLPSLAA